MNKQEVVEVAKMIAHSYNNATFTKEKLETWERFLKGYDVEQVMANLTDHIKTNQFPPTIADLVKERGRLRNVGMKTNKDIQNERKTAEDFLKQYDNERDI